MGAVKSAELWALIAGTALSPLSSSMIITSIIQTAYLMDYAKNQGTGLTLNGVNNGSAYRQDKISIDV